jgi:hypothetical protein
MPRPVTFRRAPDQPRQPKVRMAAALLAFALAGGEPVREAGAEATSQARNAAEVYERKARVEDCLVYVARDLKTRFDAAPDKGDAMLLLVVDPTTSLKNELAALRGALDEAWREGPKGLRVGVLGAGSDVTLPSLLPAHAKGSLEAFEWLPLDGVKNLLAEVRRGVTTLAEQPGGGPRALLLVSEEGGDGEDDVEAAREVLLDANVAFYALAGEAAFERGWAYDFVARKDPADRWVERFSPEPRRKETTLFFGGDVAFGLVPYRWEWELAQTEFVWAQPPRYPVPSGFGYWPLASLAYSSGGRYFLHDFTAQSVPEHRAGERKTLYDTPRLALLAPDLRPRARILKDLAKDGRARTLVRIWEHLADEALPVVQDLGTLECTPSGFVQRPARPVRSAQVPDTWFDDLDDVTKARELLGRRAAACDQALSWWAQENGRARTESPGRDPLLERLEADFQLLGVQLRRVRFHLGEALHALSTIRPLDVTMRRARILPEALGVDPMGQRPPPHLGDVERDARLADLVAAGRRIRQRYEKTPWAKILELSWCITFRKDVRILEPEEPEPRREKEPEGKKPKGPPPPPPPPKPPPPPGPRPGSGGAGPTTGK